MEEKVKVMVADRNVNVRELLLREFSAAGYEVSAARDGRELLQRIGANQAPDILVLDPGLPLLDALDIVKTLNDLIPPLPVIIHYFYDELSKHSGVWVADAFIEKSGDLRALMEAVENAVKRHYPQRGPELHEPLRDDLQLGRRLN